MLCRSSSSVKQGFNMFALQVRWAWTVLCVVQLCDISWGSISESRLSSRTVGCIHHPADIVFVLDGSSSIWPPDFQKQLDFVQHVIDQFDVGTNKTHVGVMTFSSDVETIFNLGELGSKKEIRAAINGIKQLKGETYTNIALGRLRNDMFSSLYARPGMPMIGIVITDGKSTESEETILEAKLTHDVDIQMFAVGVGASVDKEELRIIASGDEHVYMVDNYGELEELKKYIVKEVCLATAAPTTTTTTLPTTRPPPQMIQGCTGSQPMDQIWAISDHADVKQTNYAIDLMENITSKMTIGPKHVMVGLTPRLCHPGQAIRLKDHDTMEGLHAALDDRHFTSDPHTDQHLHYIRLKGMTTESGARDGTAKFGILIIDSAHGDRLEATIAEATEAKEEGIHLVVIGVGEAVELSELNEIASSKSSVVTVESYEDIHTLRPDIARIICRGLMMARWPQRRVYARRHYDLEEQLGAVKK